MLVSSSPNLMSCALRSKPDFDKMKLLSNDRCHDLALKCHAVVKHNEVRYFVSGRAAFEERSQFVNWFCHTVLALPLHAS